MHRTLRWIDRCIAAHKKPHEQNLFGIVRAAAAVNNGLTVSFCKILIMCRVQVQGGLDPELRRYCTAEMVQTHTCTRCCSLRTLLDLRSDAAQIKRDLPGYAIGGLSGKEIKIEDLSSKSRSSDKEGQVVKRKVHFGEW